eukprot:745818-Hanusia_phi.AAC.1
MSALLTVCVDAADRAYSLQEVENAVISFYMSPTNVVQANAWLVEFMQTKVATLPPDSMLSKACPVGMGDFDRTAAVLSAGGQNDPEDLTTEFSVHPPSCEVPPCALTPAAPVTSPECHPGLSQHGISWQSTDSDQDLPSSGRAGAAADQDRGTAEVHDAR